MPCYLLLVLKIAVLSDGVFALCSIAFKSVGDLLADHHSPSCRPLPLSGDVLASFFLLVLTIIATCGIVFALFFIVLMSVGA